MKVENIKLKTDNIAYGINITIETDDELNDIIEILEETKINKNFSKLLLLYLYENSKFKTIADQIKERMVDNVQV